jgi:hypothetical protein
LKKIIIIFITIVSIALGECEYNDIKVIAKSPKGMEKDDAIEYAKVVASSMLVDKIYAKIVSKKSTLKRNFDNNSTIEVYNKEIILKSIGQIDPNYTQIRYFYATRFATVVAQIECESIERFIKRFEAK